MFKINSSTHTYIIIELKLTKLALKIRRKCYLCITAYNFPYKIFKFSHILHTRTLLYNTVQTQACN